MFQAYKSRIPVNVYVPTHPHPPRSHTITHPNNNLPSHRFKSRCKNLPSHLRPPLHPPHTIPPPHCAKGRPPRPLLQSFYSPTLRGVFRLASPPPAPVTPPPVGVLPGVAIASPRYRGVSISSRRRFASSAAAFLFPMKGGGEGYGGGARGGGRRYDET